MTHKFKTGFCEFCGLPYSLRSILCDDQMKINNTHEWVITNHKSIVKDESWVCKKCNIDGFSIRQGPALAHYDCEEEIMRRALE